MRDELPAANITTPVVNIIEYSMSGKCIKKRYKKSKSRGRLANLLERSKFMRQIFRRVLNLCVTNVNLLLLHLLVNVQTHAVV